MTALKNILTCCRELAANEEDSNDNLLDKVILYSQDFNALGLKESRRDGSFVFDRTFAPQSRQDEWFSVDKKFPSQGVPCPWGVTSQRLLYNSLSDLNRRQKVHGEQLICGIGIARKIVVDETDKVRKVWHPVILLRLDIEESDNHIRIFPSHTHDAALWSMNPLCSCQGDQHTVRDLEDRFQKHLKVLEDKHMRISPFDPSTYENFLDEFRRCGWADPMSSADAPTRPASYEARELEAYWRALTGNELQLVNEWVLYTRESDYTALKKDIQSFICQLDATQAPRWASLLALKISDNNEEPRCEEHGGETASHDRLFPFESNHEQQQIADLLDHMHTFVLKAPPGTGKTHTLANLVSDAVARGRRVLVVSTDQQALQVLLKKLPACIRSLAMFFGDGCPAQEQSRTIKAVERMLDIVVASRDSEMRVRDAVDEEMLIDSMDRHRIMQMLLESKSELRAELMLLPLAEAAAVGERREQGCRDAVAIKAQLVPLARARVLRSCPSLAEAFEVREKLRCMIGEGPLKGKHLLALIMAFSAHQGGEEEPEWLEDLPMETRQEVTRLLSEKILPLVLNSKLFTDDLYTEYKKAQTTLLRKTEMLIKLKMKEHIVKSHRSLPAASIVANQFLDQLRSSQKDMEQGNQAHNWKLARKVLAQEQGLLRVFPLWIMTTGMVSEMLPSTFGLFDLVAIDEASKAEIVHLPTLLRGERVLIIGDNKQECPKDRSINNHRLQKQEGPRESTMNRMTQCIFQPGKSVFDVFYELYEGKEIVKMLREHFVCTKAIISFCNENFYNGELEPLRVPTRTQRMIPPIKVNALAEEAKFCQAEAIEKAKEEERPLLSLLSVASADFNVEQVYKEWRIMNPFIFASFV